MCRLIRVWLLCLLLAACATRIPLPRLSPEVPLPQTFQVERDDGETWLLVVQDEGAHVRFSLFDLLGVPLARQRLLDGQWRNDGLLPPNPEARSLFTALLYELNRNTVAPRQGLDSEMTLHQEPGHSYRFTRVKSP